MHESIPPLPVTEALNLLLTQIKIVSGSTTVDTPEALNRISAKAITAKRDIPRFDNSAMDGYLFRTSDLNNGQLMFPVSGEIRPEDEPPEHLKDSTSMRIMTGAPVPAGEYTVVPVENVKEKNREVEIVEIPDRNPIRRQGEGYKKGKTVLERGALIRPYELGLLIESGNMTCEVRKPIRIAVQVTGSEIGEDMDSNGPVLQSLISMWPGVSVHRWPVLDDDPKQVTARMKELKDSSDLVVTTGGISAGRHDYILRSMQDLGADILVRKVKQKPGKPFTVTQLDKVPYFHLPGNPVSAVFTADYYVRQVVMKLLGLKPEQVTAVTIGTIQNHRKDKTLFLTGRLGFDSRQRLTVTTEGKMRSHLMQLYRDNNAYVKLDPKSVYEAGDEVDVVPLSGSGLFFP